MLKGYKKFIKILAFMKEECLLVYIINIYKSGVNYRYNL